MIKKTIGIALVSVAFIFACGARETKRGISEDDPNHLPTQEAPDDDDETETETETDFIIDGDWQVINDACLRILSFYNNQFFTDTKRCGRRVQRSTGLFAAINDGMLALSYTDSICRHLNGAELYATYHVKDNMLVVVEASGATIVLKKRTSPVILLGNGDVSQNDSKTRKRDDCPTPTTPVPLPPYEPEPDLPTCIDIEVTGNGNTTIVGRGNSSVNKRMFDSAVSTNINTNTNTNTNCGNYQNISDT